MSGYDIIGDIHADAVGLRRLLSELGYKGPGYIHPAGRIPLYLGDFINRGPENREVIEIIQKTMESGAEAVMGNHEFKAICYARPGLHGHIRPHTVKNTAEHSGFLGEYPYDSDAYKRVIRWFERLPIFLQKPGFRVIHACWHENALDICRPHIRKTDRALKESAYRAYDTENPTAFNQALDTLLRGPRYKLPRGVSYIGSDGIPGKESRVFWWKDKSLPPHALIDKGDQVDAFLSPENEKTIIKLRNKFNYVSKQIVFIGHYNVAESLDFPLPNVACLNFKERMTAYRWNHGDGALLGSRLVWL